MLNGIFLSPLTFPNMIIAKWQYDYRLVDDINPRLKQEKTFHPTLAVTDHLARIPFKAG